MEKDEIFELTGLIFPDLDCFKNDNKCEIPTKVSLLDNDMNYLTLHLDITGKLDVSIYLKDLNKLSEAIKGKVDLTKHTKDLQTKLDKSVYIEDKPTFATKLDLDNKVSLSTFESVNNALYNKLDSKADLNSVYTIYLIDDKIKKLPDEEDITLSNNFLKFKDKDYIPQVYSGLGRVYLRKNMRPIIENGIQTKKLLNLLTKDMISTPNTIYIILYDFDLGSLTEPLILPDNCVLLFKGGSISNGALKGSNTYIEANYYSLIFKNIKWEGTWANDKCSVCWFGAKSTSSISEKDGFDCSDSIESAINSNFTNIYFPIGNYYISRTINILKKKDIYLEGKCFGENKNNLTATIYTNKNIDIFYICYRDNRVGESFKLTGGKIYLYYADSLSKYTHSAIHISAKDNSKIWGVDITTTILGKATPTYILEGKGIYIEGLDGSSNPKTGGNITDMRINSYIYGLDVGIELGKSNTGWITSLKDFSTIRCAKSVILNSGTNSNLYGMYQPLYAWGSYNNDTAVITINVSFVDIAGTIWDVGQESGGSYTNEYAIELGNVDYIHLGGLAANMSLHRIKNFATNKIRGMYNYEQLLEARGFNSDYNILHLNSPRYNAVCTLSPNAKFKTEQEKDKLFLEDSEPAKIIINDNTQEDVQLSITFNFKLINIFLLGFTTNTYKNGYFRTVELTVEDIDNPVPKLKNYKDKIDIALTRNPAEFARYYFSFENYYFTVKAKFTLTFKNAVTIPTGSYIKLGQIVAKSKYKNNISPSGGILYGSLYKETFSNSGYDKKKLITTDVVGNKSTFTEFDEYAPGCVLPDKNSLIAKTENAPHRVLSQSIQYPLIGKSFPSTVIPNTYKDYLLMIHSPTGKLAFYYNNKWKDSLGFEFAPNIGYFVNKPDFKSRVNKGFLYYCIDTHQYIFWDGSEWRNLDGSLITVKTNGSLSELPDINDVPLGFIFTETDNNVLYIKTHSQAIEKDIWTQREFMPKQRFDGFIEIPESQLEKPNEFGYIFNGLKDKVFYNKTTKMFIFEHIPDELSLPKPIYYSTCDIANLYNNKEKTGIRKGVLFVHSVTLDIYIHNNLGMMNINGELLEIPNVGVELPSIDKIPIGFKFTNTTDNTLNIKINDSSWLKIKGELHGNNI